MYDVIEKTLGSAECNSNIGQGISSCFIPLKICYASKLLTLYTWSCIIEPFVDQTLFLFHLAITYECIRTITTIYPRQSLIQKAANSISRFLLASNNNWKYLGITALASLVQIEPKFALDHQMTVIECLDDPDETLKRKVQENG